jgi:hypothetical protein
VRDAAGMKIGMGVRYTGDPREAGEQAAALERAGVDVGVVSVIGGIVFLAILLALMIQTRAVVRDDTSGGEQPTPDEVRHYLLQLQSLGATHAALSQTLQGLPEPEPSGDLTEFRELELAQQRLDEEIDALTARLAVDASELAEQVASNAATRAELEKLPDELADARRAVKETETEYIATRESKMQTLTLPRSKTTDALSVLLLYQSGRIYFAHRPILLGDGFNANHVTTRTNVRSGVEIRPVAGAGWSIDDAEGRRRIFETIEEARRARNIITLAVWPDSYHRFGELRERMIEEGVAYQLWPQDEDERLVVYFGAGAARIQ